MLKKECKALLDGWFREYNGRLMAFIRKSVTCQANEAEDILMEVFARACRSLQNQPGTIDHPLRWLEKIARNVCSEEVKKRVRERQFRHRSFVSGEGEELGPLDALEDNDVMTRPEQAVERQEDIALLYQHVAILPTNEKKAIYYHYTKEMTLEETARSVGRAPSTISKDVHQGLEKLRVRLVQD